MRVKYADMAEQHVRAEDDKLLFGQRVHLMIAALKEAGATVNIVQDSIEVSSPKGKEKQIKGIFNYYIGEVQKDKRRDRRERDRRELKRAKAAGSSVELGITQRNVTSFGEQFGLPKPPAGAR